MTYRGKMKKIDVIIILILLILILIITVPINLAMNSLRKFFRLHIDCVAIVRSMWNVIKRRKKKNILNTRKIKQEEQEEAKAESEEGEGGG